MGVSNKAMDAKASGTMPGTEQMFNKYWVVDALMLHKC